MTSQVLKMRYLKIKIGNSFQNVTRFYQLLLKYKNFKKLTSAIYIIIFQYSFSLFTKNILYNFEAIYLINLVSIPF